MKKAIAILAITFISHLMYAQNVGIGTPSPIERLDVNGNMNLVGTIKANGVSGVNGQFLMSTGNGLSWQSIQATYTVNQANYTGNFVPSNNFAKIDGIITLANNSFALQENNLTIAGGGFNGSSSFTVTIGHKSLVSGCSFTDVSITTSETTFINCNFNGICTNLGSRCSYINCTFTGVTSTGVGSATGKIKNSLIANSQINYISDIIGSIINADSRIGNATGSVSLISDCNIENSIIDVKNIDFTFTNNKTDDAKIIIGNSASAPARVTISNNQFSKVKTGYSDIIEIDPSSTIAKFYLIANNTFRLRLNESCSIRIMGADGSLGNSFCTITSNAFWLGLNSLIYSGNMKVYYSINVINSAGSSIVHPTIGGNLQGINNHVF